MALSSEHSWAPEMTDRRGGVRALGHAGSSLPTPPPLPPMGERLSLASDAGSQRAVESVNVDPAGQLLTVSSVAGREMNVPAVGSPRVPKRIPPGRCWTLLAAGDSLVNPSLVDAFSFPVGTPGPRPCFVATKRGTFLSLGDSDGSLGTMTWWFDRGAAPVSPHPRQRAQPTAPATVARDREARVTGGCSPVNAKHVDHTRYLHVCAQ